MMDAMFLLLALLGSLTQEKSDLVPVDDLGIRIAKGFKVTLYSDSTLANDIYAMTLDSKGRVVVTSQGWIKILEDSNGDGKADKATRFATTNSGGMGMCFDGNDLLFSGDNGLWRYRDADGDGKADGPPERISRYATGEHGHHAIRKGPDGWWYLIGGNDATIGKEHVTLPDSPVRQPHTGAIVRYSPDFKQSEVIAHGFRNPYDFDFNAWGDLFTYDSDCERDYFLPWYTPTRIYHVGYGMHHGWRLTGYLRSFANRDYFPDTVDMLWPVGRGSPTGVTVYRHTAFPPHYRDGFFALDWTFGKVYYFPLTPEGASYTTKAEVFLEPTGSDGFAPTDIAVAPDGSLYISIGGRRTRGAVYRIQGVPPQNPGLPLRPIDHVLGMPQPLDAWSRAEWEPLARQIGAKRFEAELRAGDALRAIEILTELFGGLKPEVARKAQLHPQPEVRARVAWSLGRKPFEGSVDFLLTLAEDEHPRVRVAALEALADRVSSVDPARLKSPLLSGLAHADKRVRQAAARLLSRVTIVSDEDLAKAGPQAVLSATLAGSFVPPPVAPNPKTVADALRVLKEAQNPDLRIQAIRMIVVGLGDTPLLKPAVEVVSNYSVASPPDAELRSGILAALRALLPSGDARLDGEVTRLLAMLEDEDAATVTKVAAFLTEKSNPTSDMHYLIVFSRLQGAWPDGTAERIADALLSLGRKLGSNDQRAKQTWGPRTSELAALFAKRDSRFAEALLRHPLLVHPAHVGLAAALTEAQQVDMARRFLDAARKDAAFPWSEPLVGLLSRLPSEEFTPVLRAQWSNFGMRDSILLHLARTPDPQDREKFLAGVESANAQAAKASLESLERLPRDETEKNLVPLLRLLRRLTLEPRQEAQRKQVAGLIARQSGKAFDVKEQGTEPLALRKAYQPLFDAFGSLKGDLEAGGAVDVAALIKPVPWDQGDPARGQEIFRARGCQTCHAVQGALGPNLAGAANRFSREDLFEAIANPSKDVAPLYRMTMFLMKDGNLYSGIVAFESADGYIVQTGATTTVRVNSADVAGMRPGTLSLMPNGLLDGLKPGDLADLYAHLRSLGK
jgi:putative membrane-bound dehydrogenase-like protein